MKYRSELSLSNLPRPAYRGGQQELFFPVRQSFAASLLLWAVLLFGTSACEKKLPPKTKQQIMQEKLEERLAIWKADMTGNCLEKAFEKAVLIVDSTLIANARQHRDLSGKPFIPPRPEKPAFAVPADSLPVKPLLQRGN
jgi:hypothetical protein